MQLPINLRDIFHLNKKTKEQKLFEERLYREGLEREIEKIIETINLKTIKSKDIATKFILQELDILRRGDIDSQRFVEESGFHLAEYLGASQKFQEDKEKIREVQDIFLSFLDKIYSEKLMFESAKKILNGIMEHWEIGKYSEEGQLFIKDNQNRNSRNSKERPTKSSLSLDFKKLKKTIMDKLIYLDNQIQKLLDTFSSVPMHIEQEQPRVKNENKESIKDIESTPKIYTDKRVYELMEEYSLVIEEIIIGNIAPDNQKDVVEFKKHIVLALKEGNNLASVFYPFLDIGKYIDFPITKMEDKSKKLFVDIIKSFKKRGFSVNLHKYLYDNKEDVYMLASKGDIFMQYLVDFWYKQKDEQV